MKNRRLRGRRRAAAIAVAAVFVLVCVVFTSYRLGLRPVSPEGCDCAPVTFTVGEGWNAQTIASRLHDAGLIRDRDAFITYINLHGLRPQLKAGTYSFTKSDSAPTIANDIADGRTTSKRLLVPEGYTISQIEAAAAVFGVSKTDFDAALATPHNQSFLATKPPGVSLEGYLFPDSYQVDSTTTAATLVDTMLDNFGRHVGADYQQAFAAEGLSLHQGLTVASIVEREVNIPTDRPIVAQIFLKRLKLGMPLGSDVTAQYASDLLGVPFSTAVQSPYNTLINPGLPPGPICSPGLSALDAVAHPANTDYLYFLSGNDGKTHFATTYAQHEQNIAKYLN